MNETPKTKYDLEERTGRFGEEIIEFCKKLSQDAISRPIISQFIRSATSIFRKNYLIFKEMTINN